MVVQVHTSGKPASPRRALLATMFLLLLASILAAAMAWTRSMVTLGPWIEPEGWSIAFRAPRRFSGEFGLTSFGQAYQFQGRVTPQAVATLVVYRVEAAGAGDASDVCDRILSAYLIDLPPLSMSVQTRSDTKLGAREAVEIWDPVADILVRAVVVRPGEAYAVSLSVRGASINPATYRLFDQTCASVEYRSR